MIQEDPPVRYAVVIAYLDTITYNHVLLILWFLFYFRRGENNMEKEAREAGQMMKAHWIIYGRCNFYSDVTTILQKGQNWKNKRKI